MTLFKKMINKMINCYHRVLLIKQIFNETSCDHTPILSYQLPYFKDVLDTLMHNLMTSMMYRISVMFSETYKVYILIQLLSSRRDRRYFQSFPCVNWLFLSSSYTKTSRQFQAVVKVMWPIEIHKEIFLALMQVLIT